MVTINNSIFKKDNTIEINAVYFSRYADHHAEIWSMLKGAEILHSINGCGIITNILQREAYGPLLTVLFNNIDQKMYNTESFKGGKIKYIKIAKDISPTIINKITDLWRNIDIPVDSWLNHVSIQVTGLDYTESLIQERNRLIIVRKEKIEKERKTREIKVAEERKRREDAAEQERKRKEIEAEQERNRIEIERQNALNIQLEMDRLEKEKQLIIKKRFMEQIRSYVIERDIKYLVHFTPIDNLTSILKDGLQSRNRLLNHEFILTDESRADGWLDWISLSISFPNYKMLYNKRNSMPSVNGWAVLIMRADILWELNCKFILTNAASSEIRMFEESKWSSIDAFKRMFSHEEDRHNIPDNYTTDPQAEVMVHNEISAHYIVSIAVINLSYVNQLAYLNNNRIIVRPDLFGPRIDYEYWQGSRRLSL